MMLIKLMTLLGSALFSMALEAQSAHLPNTLLYQGQPIDALCFYEGIHRQDVINLKQCGLKAEKGRNVIHAKNPSLKTKGFVGYDYRWDMPGLAYMEGFSYYKPLWAYADSAVVQTINQSGGSGLFSSLLLVQRQDDNLKITPLESGDRCNHGIVQAKVIREGKQMVLSYQVNLTSFDLWTLAKPSDNLLQANQDLQDCASCCGAIGEFKRTLGRQVSEKQLVTVRLMPCQNQEASNAKYQACFDELTNRYRTQQSSDLDSLALSKLMETFKQQCLSKS